MNIEISKIFNNLNILAILQLVGMLYVRWITYVNKVVMNFVKHCCLLNEPTCIKGI